MTAIIVAISSIVWLVIGFQIIRADLRKPIHEQPQYCFDLRQDRPEKAVLLTVLWPLHLILKVYVALLMRRYRNANKR